MYVLNWHSRYTAQMSTENKTEVLVIGALHVDELALSASPFILGESNPVRWERRAGGVGANVARAAASSQNVAVTLVANLGKDEDGNQLTATLAQAGVSVQATEQLESATGRYSAVIQPDGAVLIGLADVSQATQLTLPMIKAQVDLQAAHTVIMDGNLSGNTLQELSVALRQTAKPRCQLMAISVSPAKVNQLARSLPHLDVLFCNNSEAQTLSQHLQIDDVQSPTSLLHNLCKTGCSHIVMTDGGNGVHVSSVDDYTHIPVKPVASIQTSNGPGDALAGATAAQLCHSELTHIAVIQAVKNVGLAAAENVLSGQHQAPLL